MLPVATNKRQKNIFFLYLAQYCVQVCGVFEGCGALGGEAAADCQVQIGIRGHHRLGQALHSCFQLIEFSHDLILPGLQSFDGWVHLAILKQHRKNKKKTTESGLNHPVT